MPDVFWHELRNLLLSAERRGQIDAGHADSFMALARTRRLDAYGAIDLALTIPKSCALASPDRRLNWRRWPKGQLRARLRWSAASSSVGRAHPEGDTVMKSVPRGSCR